MQTAPPTSKRSNSESDPRPPRFAAGGLTIRKTATDLMQPLKIRDARRLILKAGATIKSGGSHDKVTHPAIAQTFHLPAHGSKGRPTLSPGMTHEFHKFHALMLAAKSAA